MQPDLLDLHVLHHFRTRSPLTHCMTNDVVQTFTANILLTLGASPAMVIEAEEAEQFAAMADALLINVGTLTSPRAQSMRRAIESAVAAGKPWTLDPVGVGALAFRTRFCQQVLTLKPAAIRGNASEILALAGMSAGGRGVDTTDTAARALPAAQALARQTNAIVAVTGEVDYVTDGQRTKTIAGGDPMMTRVVGTGCALSAVVAASCSLPGDRLDNVAAACGWMKRAGSVAASQSAGPGSFACAFIDALWNLEAQA
ncbi:MULTISPECIES: hydroxyethylthiazole kinase [Lelliottia]|uniref:Hydroxyethylthiazole kinase n=1 Tax=Lelliottia wanjuensis TaxID=3050585 RepID=A0AAP4FTR3_9ENTR|nr:MULTISPECIES: hydroxyethylthiazole kinase [unclassified Lelliottia]MDK9362360.1 hydroxyethylthiazole kinase [Lelliottia sp. V106_12]MDK9587211.1 hydroxyethylthiazole kinase [Lelliottia sp. V86_10]MDK9616829.1 hydroxyethylthiazole kinase [Lelliottia sp. V106_9]